MKAPKDHWIIQIDITNACIHTCSNCTRLCMHQKKPYMMEYETFCQAVESIIDHPGIIGIMGGEPTLHPEFEKMCKYLYTRLDEERKPDQKKRALPTDNFLKMYKLHEVETRELHKYSDGWRSITKGAGLTTSVSKEFLEHLEIIQDTFMFQCHNDHVKGSLHQPILISRKDVGIDDKKWIELREKCWINRRWSSSITPKGCFFCEVAGVLDYIFDGPGGLPIEKDWWKRDISDFSEQFSWCELCGIPLDTFARDARECVTDVSKSNLDLLKKNACLRIDENHINVVKISNGKILDCKINGKENTNETYYLEKVSDRITSNAAIYAKDFFGILICTASDSDEKIKKAILNNKDKLKDILVIYASEGFEELIQAFQKIGKHKYVFCFTTEIILSKEGIEKLKRCVVNPGTLHYINFSKPHINKNEYIENSNKLKSGTCMLINTSAHSIVDNLEILRDKFKSLDDLKEVWQKEKIVELSNAMNGAMYGEVEISNREISIRRMVHFLKKEGIVKTLCYTVQKIKSRVKEKNKLLWV